MFSAVIYAFALQDPVFLAKFGALIPSGGGHLSVTPYLFGTPSSPWPNSGFAYACGSAGPGVLMISNTGHANENMTGISITYSGSTFTATGPACTLPPGKSDVSITALSGFAPPPGTAFNGTLGMSDGNSVPFSGTWS